MVTALNKLDLVQDRALLAKLELERPSAVAISATSGQGVDQLLKTVAEQLHRAALPGSS